MNIAKHPIVIGLIGLASLVYFLKLLEVELPQIVDDYLNDFLCMPIVLSLSLSAIRILKKNKHIYVPLSAALLLTLYYAFHFEWFMPKLMSRYTTDLVDVGLYFLGTLVFCSVQKRLF